MNPTIPTRPVLRWHGGKWLLAPWIIEHFPEHRIYTEVYGGAASVLMQKRRAYAEVYNDLDQDVVNLFKILRNQVNAAELKRRLELTPYSRVEFMKSIHFEEDNIDRARGLIIRSFMGFGSDSTKTGVATGFRANSNRSGTTPAHDWTNYPEALEAMTERLKGVIIECREATEILKQHDGPDVLHYLDPPYVFKSRKRIHGNLHGYNHEMTDEQHTELARVVRDLKGMVIISGYRSELYDELYKGFVWINRKTFGDGASPRTEVLWMNDAAYRNQPQGKLL
jgi:DNA adenine methylase